MKTAAEQGGQRRVHVHHPSGSNDDRAARMYLNSYYRRHSAIRRRDFLQFIAKTKQPLAGYEAFILYMDDRNIYFRSLKALYGFCWRRRYFRVTIIRIWKESNGLHFVCAPDQCLFTNSGEEILCDARGRLKPQVREADITLLKAKLMMK